MRQRLESEKIGSILTADIFILQIQRSFSWDSFNILSFINRRIALPALELFSNLLSAGQMNLNRLL